MYILCLFCKYYSFSLECIIARQDNLINIYNYWPHFNNTVFFSCRDGDGVVGGGGGRETMRQQAE